MHGARELPAIGVRANAQTVFAAVVAVIVLSVGGPSASSARAAHASLRGTIRYATFYSASLGGDVGYAVYFPPGYTRTRTRYPVVYYLHGLPSSATSYRVLKPIAQAVEASGHESLVVGIEGPRR